MHNDVHEFMVDPNCHYLANAFNALIFIPYYFVRDAQECDNWAENIPTTQVSVSVTIILRIHCIISYITSDVSLLLPKIGGHIIQNNAMQLY